VRRSRLPGALLIRAAAAAALLSLAASLSAALQGAVPPPPALPDMGEPLPIAESVKDPLFSILLGLVAAERQGVLRGERLDHEVRARGGSKRFLYRKIAWLSRRPIETGAAEVRVQFVSPIELQFPYSILGYHPGKVRATSACRLREWYLGDQELGVRGGRFSEVRLYALEEGDVLADVDGWIDVLAGDALDDTRLSGMALMRHGARRYGVAFGQNAKGEGRAGVLDFVQDRVLMPPPSELKGVARDLVRRVAALRKGPAQGPT
jgi:hypothetical protein